MTPVAVFVLIACVIAGTLIGRRGRRGKGALFGLLAGAAAAVAVTVVLRAVPSGPAVRDYRDPAQLAEAVKGAEHSASASCGKLPTGKYFCAVAYTDGASGNYTVTVSPDGSSYTAS